MMEIALATALSVYPQNAGMFLLLVYVSGITDEKSVALRRRSYHFLGVMARTARQKRKIYHGGKIYHMKRRRTIEELLGALNEHTPEGKPEVSSQAHGGSETEQQNRWEAERKLGAAMLERLSIPEGDVTEFVDSIISAWDAGSEKSGAQTGSEAGGLPIERAMIGASEAHDGEKAQARLPLSMRAGVTVPPEADYDSMSSEQFRRLKKQLQRAAADGRRVRL